MLLAAVVASASFAVPAQAVTGATVARAARSQKAQPIPLGVTFYRDHAGYQEVIRDGDTVYIINGTPARCLKGTIKGKLVSGLVYQYGGVTLAPKPSFKVKMWLSGGRLRHKVISSGGVKFRDLKKVGPPNGDQRERELVTVDICWG